MMTLTQTPPLPKLNRLPLTMPDDGTVVITLQEGVPVFRASRKVQQRIHTLLDKEKMGRATQAEQEELDRYEEIDDYLSHLNRLVRNLSHEQAG